MTPRFLSTRRDILKAVGLAGAAPAVMQSQASPPALVEPSSLSTSPLVLPPESLMLDRIAESLKALGVFTSGVHLGEALPWHGTTACSVCVRDLSERGSQGHESRDVTFLVTITTCRGATSDGHHELIRLYGAAVKAVQATRIDGIRVLDRPGLTSGRRIEAKDRSGDPAIEAEGSFAVFIN